MVVFGASVSCGGTNAKAPMSQAAPCGRLTPRWSVAGGGQATAASIAALGRCKAWVSVGPPLAASGPRLGSAESAKPQALPGHSRLEPSSVMVPAQFPPSLLATIVLLSVAVAAFHMPPPVLLALLPVMVELFTVRVAPPPRLSMPPPSA